MSMTYGELMERVYEAIPHLRGQLELPQVVYRPQADKAYITFRSSTLVEEKTFQQMESMLQKLFVPHHIALRVVSPALAEDFRRNISAYQQVLVDFLRRNYPASAAWMDQIDWRSDGDKVTLTMPDRFSLEYMGRNNAAGRLAQAILDIFGIGMRVELALAGDQEKRLEELRAERVLAHEQTFTPEVLRQMSEEAAKKAAASGAASPQPKPQEHGPGKPIMGRAIADPPVEMRELASDTGMVVVEGDIFKLETKELKGGEMLLLSFAVTDYTSSVLCKTFLRYRKGFFGKRKAEDNDLPPITDEERKAVQDKVALLKTGMRVKVRGDCMYDNFARELSISIRDLVPMKKTERTDTAEEKRVELHMHTNMSSLDALASAEDLIKRAAKWGHPAVAVTDHGVLQAFPDAFRAAKSNKIKLIPGCEGYLTEERDIVSHADSRPCTSPIVVLDFEATGLNTSEARIIEIGAVRLNNGTIEDSISVLVNPGMPLPAKITEITGIRDAMLEDAKSAAEELPKLMDFIGDCPIAAHNASYDVSLLKAELKRLGMHWDGPVVDTLTLSRKLYPEMKTHKLGSVCKHLGVSLKNAHRAVHDATATAQCLEGMLREAAETHRAHTLKELNSIHGGAVGESYHIILLVKSQQGLVNLNRLVTISHLEHFRRRPHMMRAEIEANREGLIIGSACEAGELFRAVLNGADEKKLKKIASFYDYLEIQPIGNNAFLLRDGQVKTEEDLRNLNRTIVRLADELGKPCVATGDVHFLDPHNAINRAIIQAGMGYDDCDKQPPLYLKTTDEMLAEFAYLGPQKCREVVIDNPRKIADMVEDGLRLFPKHPKGEDTFQPLWEDAADNIQDMTWAAAKKLYGDPLPEIVSRRLEKELRSIVGYGYCTLYNIAQKLVTKSLEDGYLVGSRGSVGSSLVARMCDITEVNALPPHYRCVHCRKGFFDVDKSRYQVGVDLPDMDCPDCGSPLVKDGFDIPFEVFLGFEGDKVPDIDLNFSDEYQNRAHHHVEELFGRDHVFRAGTIGTLAEKTGFGYVSKYMEERGIQASGTEKDRLAAGLVGVKRTTGQHPGGMVVVPKEYDINQFTAVQHPADDLGSDFTTTHFDFNSMHDILVKLDCLGHLDPTMMHYLEEITGVNYKDVPLDDPGVRTLFHSPAALGVTEDEIVCNTGTYGVPEFGTGFVRGMLDETKPSTMEELIRISGLSHGTDVWLDNAQAVIASGAATLKQCVCCRDDIMNYLISKGVNPKLAFTTMESVRKGKGLKPEMEQAMLDHDVPDWFIGSCKKIKYMFPKGHAVAYVTMSLRVAWFKLHMPSAYYAAYFTVRGSGFDACTMLLDPDTCRRRILEIRNAEKATAKEKEQQTSLELVLEMNMRGIKFLPVDLYRSDVSRFLIEDGNLRCPFTSLSGLGASAALPIIEARQKQPFVSVEDLKERGHVGQSTIDLLRAHGSLDGLPETSQMSFFG